MELSISGNDLALLPFGIVVELSFLLTYYVRIPISVLKVVPETGLEPVREIPIGT